MYLKDKKSTHGDILYETEYVTENLLLKVIKEDAFRTKWLIFVSSKRYGKGLQTRISSLIENLISENKILLLKHRVKLKKGKDRRKAAICKSLKIAELPYTLVKRYGS